MTNYPYPNGSSGLEFFLPYLDEVTGGLFGIAVLIIVFICSVFIVRDALGSVIAGAMLITAFASMMLFVMGLTSEMVLIACVLAAAASAAIELMGGPGRG